MKKAFLKPVLWLIAIMFISPMFLASSCNNTDDDQDPRVTDQTARNKELIIGYWESYKVAEVEYLNGQIQSADTVLTPVDHPDYTFINFTSDGKAVEDNEEVGNYLIEDNKLTITSVEGNETFNILTLTQDKLTLSYDEISNVGGQNKKSTSTLFLERISLTTTKSKK